MFSDLSSEEDTLMTTEDAEHIAGSARKSVFECLDEACVSRKAEALVVQTSSLLSLSTHEAKALLRFYKWDENRLNDEWFSEEAKVRDKVGLLLEDRDKASGEGTSTSAQGAVDPSLCGICFENFPEDFANFGPLRQNGVFGKMTRGWHASGVCDVWRIAAR